MRLLPKRCSSQRAKAMRPTETRVFLPPAYGAWDAVMAETAAALGAFAAER